MPSFIHKFLTEGNTLMMPLSDFPPDLNTPFNDMVGFLLRITTPLSPEDYYYIRSVSKTFDNFIDLPVADMSDVIALCIKYGYFDNISHRRLTLNGYLEAMDADRLDKLKKAAQRLLAEGGEHE